MVTIWSKSGFEQWGTPIEHELRAGVLESDK